MKRFVLKQGALLTFITSKSNSFPSETFDIFDPVNNDRAPQDVC